VGTSAFWAAVGATVTAALTGLAIVIVIALPMALLISRYEFFRLSTWIPIEFLKPIPPVALIPLGLLMVGPTAQLKISLIVFAALWPLVTQMVYGMKEIDGVAKDMSRSYRLGTWLGLTRITLPSILPFAVTGLRISAAIALVVAIVVELIAGVPGLGQTIGLAQISGQIAQMYAGIVAAGILGLTFNGLFSLAAKKLLFWHPSVRSA
jgi:ABC-type nitrate/sulfonate/bicarbonate transport system permease component